MTAFFEVLDRDGPARIGELRLDEPVSTPTFRGEWFVDAGSEWIDDHSDPAGGTDRVTLLPHRALPVGTDVRVAEAFGPEAVDRSTPTAVLINRQSAGDLGADCYVLAGGPAWFDDPRTASETLIEVKEAIPPDTALYVPGVATPANVSLLLGMGVDVIDTDRVATLGAAGWYLTTDGRHRLSDLEELPCACSACQTTEAFDRRDCIEHNEAVLAAEVRRVRERIRADTLRSYLEGAVRSSPSLTATFRHVDQEETFLERHAPVCRSRSFEATTAESLDRPDVRRFIDRVKTRYQSRFRGPVVLVPCSAKKPYSESQSHGQFHKAINYRAQKVSLTSPLGVVPQELECTYPAQHYDTAVSGHWSAGELDLVADALESFLETAEPPRIIAHVGDGGYREICERVEQSLDRSFEYTVGDHPTTKASLGALDDALADELRYSKRQRQLNTIQAIADYQFGAGAGEALFDEIRIQSRWPKLRAHQSDGTQLAAMVPSYGLLSLTLAGARRWRESDIEVLGVEIDEFVPHGSVLAPGIVEADSSVRVGDEVIVEGPRALAIGRAQMHGKEMADSTRGEAIDVRHVEET